ncbi:MAG: hypothetical protein ACK559_02650, partial [bacterium]
MKASADSSDSNHRVRRASAAADPVAGGSEDMQGFHPVIVRGELCRAIVRPDDSLACPVPTVASTLLRPDAGSNSKRVRGALLA